MGVGVCVGGLLLGGLDCLLGSWGFLLSLRRDGDGGG